MSETAQNLLTYLALILVAVGMAMGIHHFIFNDTPEPETSSISQTLEDRCDFVMKTTGTPFTISENQAGTYNYELYMTSEGYIEVWECPKSVIE